MFRFLVVTESFLFPLLILLFPSFGKCQDILKPDSAAKLQLNNYSKELPLTLTDTVNLALQNNRDLKVAYLQRILDKEQLAEAKSIFNPTLTPQLSFNFNNNSPISSGLGTGAGLGATLGLKTYTGGTVNLMWTGASLLDIPANANILNQGLILNYTQPLLKGTKTDRLSIEKAKVTESTNIINFQDKIAQKITDTIVSYRNLYLAQERLKIQQSSLANSRKDLDRLQALFEFGRIAKSDIVQRQADIAQQEVSLVNAQQSLEQTISDLSKIIDLPSNLSTRLIAIEHPQALSTLNLPPFQEMLEQALTHNNNYLNALNNVETSKLDLRNAENQQKLDLSFMFNYNFADANDAYDTGNWSSALVLQHQFGVLSQDNLVKKSKISLQTNNLNLETTRQNLEEDLKLQIRNIESTFRAIELAQNASQLAEEKLKNAKKRLDSTSSNTSLTDIITFEQTLLTNRNQEISAITNHLNAVTRLDQFLGITLSKWGIQQNAEPQSIGKKIIK